ncbi:M20/M25/M40 family metallo-hydrolase [Pseudorhodoplanes sp.]|uniref:M20/M25/M40 family metallo-hydrolase n=1 Tax=Pseudorhodoplanes sp. TaxID=1934341 RepID=UPI003D151858
MDPKDLSFDVDETLAGIKSWVECESPTYDASAVNRMMDIAARHLVLLGADVSRAPGGKQMGDCVRGRFNTKDQNTPGVLILGHLDTVHPVGTLKKLPWRREGDKCYGPGALDMKGGNYLALQAIHHLQAAKAPTPLPVTVLFTSDEEIGSPSTRELIEAEASRNKYVLIPEPGRRNGGVVTGRYAVARYRLTVTGKPSHAGLLLNEGISAIEEMARQIVSVNGKGDDETTFSVGVVRGGQWVNCVATTCEAEILSVAKSPAALERSSATIRSLAPTHANVTLETEQTLMRPIWTTSPSDHALYSHAQSIAKHIGFDIPPQNSGGGSDGNFTGALGVPTLDGLGVCGDFPHTLDEHLIVSNIADRGRLLAGLLSTLS